MLEQGPRVLKRETIERFAREWEKRPRDSQFTMRARVKDEKEDIIEVYAGVQDELAPEGTTHRGLQDAIKEMKFLHSGDLITDREMNNDLLPGYKASWEVED